MGKGLRAESTVSAPFTTIYYGEGNCQGCSPSQLRTLSDPITLALLGFAFLSPHFSLSDHLMRYNDWIAMFRFAATIGRH